MATAIHTALSGLMAETRRFAVSAYNVANLRSAGADPAASAAAGRPASTTGAAPYIPLRTLATTVAAEGGGGVRTLAVPVTPPSVALFNPAYPAADGQGLVHLPNVSLEEELVTQMIAVRSFQANLAVLEAQDEMTGALLDLET